MKKLLAMILTAMTVMSLGTSALAAEPTSQNSSEPVYTYVGDNMTALPEGVSDVVVTEDKYSIMPAAISGYGSYFDNQGTIYVHSPGSSLFGHLKIRTSLSYSNIFIACYDPNGKLLNPKLTPGTDFVSIGPGEHNINMLNAPAGTYKLVFAAEDGGAVKVEVSLHDWYH